MKKILRHGRNSKPSSGGGGGGGEDYGTDIYFDLLSHDFVDDLSNIATVIATHDEDGSATIDYDGFVSGDYLDLAFWNLPDNTTINISTSGQDMTNIASINGDVVDNNYQFDHTIYATSDYEKLDENGNHWNPKQYWDKYGNSIELNDPSSNGFIPLVIDIRIPGKPYITSNVDINLKV